MPDLLGPPAITASVHAYLAHQRAFGRAYVQEEWILRRFCKHLLLVGADDLDRDQFDCWCRAQQGLHPNTQRTRQLVIRHLCLYRQRTEPSCFVPSLDRLCRPKPYAAPFIVESEQIARMLQLTDRLTPTQNSPLMPAVLRLAIVLLYTAGLRRGELLRLTLDDIEARSGVLRIRQSKFHKSRLVPLSSGARNELRIYLRQRLTCGLDASPSAPLLCHCKSGLHGYTGTGLSRGIDALFESAGVRHADGRRPRIHDLRHSFAVQALIRWYQEGADVQAHLPKLALYMGHVSIVSTAYYLRWVPTLAALASQRFETAYGDIVRGGSS